MSVDDQGLLEAFVAWLAEDGPCLAAFGQTANAQKFWTDPGDPATDLPYLVAHSPTGTIDYDTPGDVGTPTIEDVEFQVTVYASSKAEARKLRKLLVRRVAAATFELGDQDECYYLRARSIGGGHDATLGPDSAEVYSEFLLCRALVAGVI